MPFIVSLIPLVISIFILGLLSKFGRETTVGDTQLLIAVYIISFLVKYFASLVKEFLYLKNSYISSDKNGIEVYSSIIGQNKNIIPYINLHSFEVNQGFLERLIGLSTIYIYTDGEEAYELPGFRYNQADSFIKGAVEEYGLKIK